MEHRAGASTMTCKLCRLVNLVTVFPYRCVCGRVIYADGRVIEPDDVSRVLRVISVSGRPGACLKQILFEAGVIGEGGCGCDDYAKLMDLWGCAVCQERIEEITTHLNSQNVSWFDMLRVAKAGYLTTRSLVQAAIDKAKE